MKILEYDQVDPWQVLRLNLLCLDFHLTPERVAEIRQVDDRPFPFFALYAVEDGVVAGQVGVFRLPVVTTEGPDEVGGIWAVATHPSYSRRGFASRLIIEAHRRMRMTGLKFSTLGTSRRLGAYTLYRGLGYEDVSVYQVLYVRRDDLNLTTSLVATAAKEEEYHLVDSLFSQAAKGRYGFARRQLDFMRLILAHGDVSAENLFVLHDENQPVGYAFAKPISDLLKIDNLLLLNGVRPVEAIAALLALFDSSNIWLRVETLETARNLEQAGLPTVFPGWRTFMVKALSEDTNVKVARQVLQSDSDHFLISMFDIT